MFALGCAVKLPFIDVGADVSTKPLAGEVGATQAGADNVVTKFVSEFTVK